MSTGRCVFLPVIIPLSNELLRVKPLGAIIWGGGWFSSTLLQRLVSEQTSSLHCTTFQTPVLYNSMLFPLVLLTSICRYSLLSHLQTSRPVPRRFS
jgi:hypothetical protein